MLKTTIAFTIIFTLTRFGALSQNFEKQFKELSTKNDTVAQGKLLKQWESATPKDPELFIAYFNYYAIKSLKEIVSIDENKKDNASLELTDSTGKTTGYLSSSLKYDAAIFQRGFDYIDRGIALYPARLDMRFGKIYMLGEAENYSVFTKSIIETINYDNTINHAWLWEGGKPLEDPKKFFLDAVQDYVATIYNTEDDNLLPYMRQISEAVLKYFPDHVESLDNVALTFLIARDYDKALPYLLKAEKVNPKDVIVLNNIAEAYKRKKDNVNAKIYYEKILKYGNAEEIQDAKKQIKSLP